MNPGEVEHSQEHAQEHSRGMKLQPESATEDLEDAVDQGNADDGDMNTNGTVCEEPVITIGVDGEKWDECENDEESYVDDVNGGFRDPEMVREARMEESAGYLKMQVYCRVPVAECGSHKVIQSRWVDRNEGDERSPDSRCRLVAKEVKKRNNTEEESANFFACTPPSWSSQVSDLGSHDQKRISEHSTIEDEFH